MNIGIVTTWFERGASYVSRQYFDILREGHNVYIYARDGEEYALNSDKWNIKNIVTWGKKTDPHAVTAVDIYDFEKWIKDNNIQCVFFNEQRYWEPIILCNKLKIKTGAYIDYYTEETIPFFNCYDFLICNTKSHYSIFKSHPQAYYIPWGTDVNLFKPRTYEIVNDKCITFFHSAGYSPYRKGTDKVLLAFNELKEKDCKLIIHSQVRLSEFYPNYSLLINELVKEGKLELYEKTVSAPGLYFLGDIYVYPSKLDGIGLTIAEALACGLPTIVSDNPPMNEFINNKEGKKVKIQALYAREDGYYWPQCEIDMQNLIECMNYFIENKNCIKEMKIQARKFAEENLNWNKNEKSINDIFTLSTLIDIEKKQSLFESIENFDLRNQPLEYRLNNILSNIVEINGIFNKINNNLPIIIYGAGEHTLNLLKYTNLKYKNIELIVDKDYKNKNIDNYKICSPEILKNRNCGLVIISSYEYQEEIYKYIVNKLNYLGEIVRIYNNNERNVFYR
jgi:Glycosyltransferase